MQRVYTVQEFCSSHRISHSQLYNFWKQGTGPRYFRNGARRRITEEAAAEWRKELEAKASQGQQACQGQVP